jgi:hypothetical protein
VRCIARSYKKSMEYLFLGEHPLMAGEMDRIVEAGLKPPSAMAALVRARLLACMHASMLVCELAP